MLFYLLALFIAAIDQLLKYFVHKQMFFGQSIPLLGNVIKLTYVRNTGAAFSLFVGFSPYLAFVGFVVSLFVIYFHHKIPKEDIGLHIALAFILGGSLGNLIDRVFRSYVIDYIDLTIWPVFNFADIMINVGAILVFILLFFERG